MPLPSPEFAAFAHRLRTGEGDVAAELLGEQASALGRMGRTLETALARLAEGQANGVDAEARETLLRVAADAVWQYFVQREVVGINDQKAAIAHYGIPAEVLNRVGGR
jgi:hypothetical protein